MSSERTQDHPWRGRDIDPAGSPRRYADCGIPPTASETSRKYIVIVRWLDATLSRNAASASCLPSIDTVHAPVGVTSWSWPSALGWRSMTPHFLTYLWVAAEEGGRRGETLVVLRSRLPGRGDGGRGRVGERAGRLRGRVDGGVPGDGSTKAAGSGPTRRGPGATFALRPGRTRVPALSLNVVIACSGRLRSCGALIRGRELRGTGDPHTRRHG